jgi:hypothetical protein
MTFDNCDFRSTADFANQFSKSRPNFTTHDWLTILCDPDNMQVDAKNRVRAMSIFSHAAHCIMQLKTC